MQGNVVQMKVAVSNGVPPKSVRSMYRKHEIILTFQPSTRSWAWKTKHTYTIEFDGVATTQERAVREAQRCVDKCIDGEA